MIITVPHGLCSPSHTEKYHMCDLSARSMAVDIYNNVPRGINKLILVPSVTREVEDQNRRRSRETTYRSELRTVMENSSGTGKYKWLVDVHSFPPTSSKLDMYVLEDAENFSDYALDFVEHMKKNGINASVFHGADNDIHVESRIYGLKSFLVEFNEGNGEKKRKEIVKSMLKWFFPEEKS